MMRLLLCLLFLLPITLFAENFEAGKDYSLIQNNSTSEAPQAGTVKVTEFFSYGCPWCYRIEPGLNQWVVKQGSNISFSRVPVVFNKNWEYYAKAYYTAKALDKNAQLTPALFKAILEEKRSLSSAQAMIDFFTAQGVDAKIAQSAFEHSPSIELAVSAGKQQMMNAQIQAIPALVVNNRYKTDLQMAKSEERLFAILDFLVKEAKRQKTN